ncbi:SusC/RagA family TonB-linked outer membrane protein [Flavitalea flava]
MNVSFAPKLLLLGTFCCLGLLRLNAQQPAGAVTGPVTGTVKNEKGEPVESASVQVLHKGKGVYTGKTGAFSLLASPEDSLLITSVGYENLRTRVQAVMSLVLRPSSSTILNDVVVIGYGSTRKKELTGSITTVNSKDFQMGAITTPEQLIAGKVAGVSITSNGGAPGAGSTIRIRGGASLNASNDPLIVIDGLPFSGNNIYGSSNALSLVNPNDIESFTVLKDAAATAIYGSRASNGVLMITTKKGKAGSPVLSFTTQVSLAKLIKETSVLSSGQFRHLVDSLGSGTYDGTHTYKSLLGSANTDWQKEIFRAAISTDNNLSLTGAVKNMPYRVSVGYLNQEGIVRTDNLQRFSGGISLSPRLLDGALKIDINLKGALSKARFANGSAIQSAISFDPTQPVHAKNEFGNYFEWASTTGSTVTLTKLATRNPVSLLDLYHNQSEVQRSFGSVQIDYALPFLPDLHANVNLGYDVAKGSGTIKVPAYAGQNFLDTGQNNQYRNSIANTVAEFYLSYDKKLSSLKSRVTATGGYGYYDNLSKNYFYPFVQATGHVTQGTNPPHPYDKPQTVLLSYYGRLVYSYDDRYYLAGTIRTDGSSRFNPDVRWGVFPSAAFTWRVSQEQFLKNNTTLSDLKLRLSYGVTGNQDGIGAYPYQAVYSTGDNSSRVQFGDSTYNMASPGAYDANIKWETTTTYNAGLDYGFLQNRITGSIDFYQKKTKDLLNIAPVAAGTNFSNTLLTNVGNVENKGVEVQISANLVKTRSFSWDAGFNVAYNKTTITNLTASKDPSFPGTLYANNVQINAVGYDAGSFYVYHQVYEKTGRPIEGVYEDVNKDGLINTQDLYKYKSPFPKWIMGFSTQFTYNRWTLSTVLRANVGNYMYNNVAQGANKASIFNTLGFLSNTLTDVLHSQFINGQSQSDYFVQNASFLKMDNLGLSYKLGSVFRQHASLRINANCQNVFTVTKYTGMDPEIYGGYDNVLYPRPRVYVLGVNLQF